MPAKLAKIITTVDIISNGRINFGVGAGWFKNEAISYGFDWENHKERITKMLEGLEIILKLWKEDKATYNGNYKA
jgi:alkanesulfonate monooxygenase SsuD/methylene tetrahydromethanopterin reductase-like flavin-dependent oxidoreductase (luciferase family)